MLFIELTSLPESETQRQEGGYEGKVLIGIRHIIRVEPSLGPEATYGCILFLSEHGGRNVVVAKESYKQVKAILRREVARDISEPDCRFTLILNEID